MKATWTHHIVHPRGSGVDQPRTISNSDNAKSNRPTAHTAQASRAAARWSILPTTPRLGSGSRLSAVAPICVLCQPHPTPLASPDRYERRYGEEVPEERSEDPWRTSDTTLPGTWVNRPWALLRACPLHAVD